MHEERESKCFKITTKIMTLKMPNFPLLDFQLCASDEEARSRADVLVVLTSGDSQPRTSDGRRVPDSSGDALAAGRAPVMRTHVPERTCRADVLSGRARKY